MLYPMFMEPCASTTVVIEKPVETYISSGGGIPVGMKIVKNISVKIGDINTIRKKIRKDIKFIVGDYFVTKSKRS